VRFESDGTGVRDTTAVIRVQNQAGMQQFGQLIFGYSSATERLGIPPRPSGSLAASAGGLLRGVGLSWRRGLGSAR
jgi:hypothetical protein